jgi:hypothetical protein
VRANRLVDIARPASGPQPAAGACRKGESGGWLGALSSLTLGPGSMGKPLPPTRPLHARGARLNQALDALLASALTLPHISCSVASTNAECTT